jgi:N-acetylglucosaminyldiphosphoundecaprenol N-acetyl-beta-D-mannosaminyltransferase
MRQTVGILGTPIDLLDTQGVMGRLEQFIQERRFHQVATANTDFLINAISDPELRYILRNAELVVPDGMPVVWASKLMRAPLPERVTGADLVPALAAMAAKNGYRVYMLGAAPDVAKKARGILEETYPGLQIVGCVSPPLTPLLDMDHETILRDIEKASPDILLVAFGNPKQEKWIHMHRERLRSIPVCIGVGGTFDFIAGETSRAPEWMQKSGLEWCYRLGQDPKRLWKRYYKDFWQFARYVIPQWWVLRHGHRAGSAEIIPIRVDDKTVLSIIGDFKAGIVSRFQALAEEAFRANTHLILDFQGMTSFDAKALGTLIHMPKRAALFQREVRLIYLPPAVRTALQRSHVGDGLYVVADSIAEAFAQPQGIGLCWKVQCNKTNAVVTMSGASEPKRVQQLQDVCRRLLESGKRVDMDTHGITYADTQLITALYQLSKEFNASGSEPVVRLSPGYTVNLALQRNNALEKFVIIETPELPEDAIEMVTDVPDTLRAAAGSLPFLPMAAYAPRA